MRDILQIVHLIHFLENENATKESKVNEIKFMRDNGHITEDEAITLAIEYFTK